MGTYRARCEAELEELERVFGSESVVMMARAVALAILEVGEELAKVTRELERHRHGR
jgi:hypothetical protein